MNLSQAALTRVAEAERESEGCVAVAQSVRAGRKGATRKGRRVAPAGQTTPLWTLGSTSSSSVFLTFCL